MPLGAQLLGYSYNVTGHAGRFTQRHDRTATQPYAYPVSPSTLQSLTKVSIVNQSDTVANLMFGAGHLPSSDQFIVMARGDRCPSESRSTESTR